MSPTSECHELAAGVDQDILRSLAEAEAALAEKELLEGLDEEAERIARERRKREKRKLKERQRKSDRSGGAGAVAGGSAEEAFQVPGVPAVSMGAPALPQDPELRSTSCSSSSCSSGRIGRGCEIDDDEGPAAEAAAAERLEEAKPPAAAWEVASTSSSGAVSARAGPAVLLRRGSGATSDPASPKSQGPKWSDMLDDMLLADEACETADIVDIQPPQPKVPHQDFARRRDLTLEGLDGDDAEDAAGISDFEDDDGDITSPHSPTSPSRRRNRRRRRRGDKAPGSTTHADGAEDGKQQRGGAPKQRGVVTWSDLGFSGLGLCGRKAPSAGEALSAVASASAPGQLCIGSPLAAPSALPTSPQCLSTSGAEFFGSPPPGAPPAKSASDASGRFAAMGPPPSWTPLVATPVASAGPSAAAWCGAMSGDASERHAAASWTALAMPSTPGAGCLSTNAGLCAGMSPCGDASSRAAIACCPTASPGGCEGTMDGSGMQTWLCASPFPPSGEDLAQQLRALAPEAYED
mmetsp:Transcript_22985/g.66590  ORF Transcript_22985/g.66590 Transcript_22985/m.66590 type:complete len:522 (+) Transcript_22985:67-1632(+)